MRRLLATLALAALALAAQRPAVVTREEMTTVEKYVDRSIRGLNVDDPFDLLGFTRGVYLPGYGVVFTAEVNLVVTPITPFHQAPVGSQLERLHQKKLQRIKVVRELMRDSLVEAAATLDPVPANEKVVFGMTLFYRAFEIRQGLPGQIIMQAPKQKLLDYKANRIGKEQLEAAIQVQEL
ncbi:MAG: hypothetical protein ACM336_08910 [Acidobacteriota bacterium]